MKKAAAPALPPRHPSMKRRSCARKSSSSLTTVTPSVLAQDWAPILMKHQDESSSSSSSSFNTADNGTALLDAIRQAVGKTISLLQQPPHKDDVTSAVPFVCRYRTDVIHPLTTEQVHLLSDLLTKHQSLQSLRQRVLKALLSSKGNNNNNNNVSSSSSCGCDGVMHRIQVSTSRHELEDLYAPYRPPSRGSVEEQMRTKHPELARHVEQLFGSTKNDDEIPKNTNTNEEEKEEEEEHPNEQESNILPMRMLKPRRDALVHLMGSKIAAEPAVMDLVLDTLSKHCHIKTTTTTNTTLLSAKEKPEKKDNHNNNNKYVTYHDFSSPLCRLRDHQVLAIRRGVEQKQLKLSYENVDGPRMERSMHWTLFHKESGVLSNTVLAQQMILTQKKKQRGGAWWLRQVASEAIHDAWTRLLRRRGTTRLWRERCAAAQQQAIRVFEANLRSALLSPPLLLQQQQASCAATPSSRRGILAVDPGFRAGIKCAILKAHDGTVVRDGLSTVHFVNSRKEGIQQFGKLLRRVCELTAGSEEEEEEDASASDVKVVVALGNGHGSQEARSMLLDAADGADVNVDIHLVTEAGASVWSVTPQAKVEFPEEPPSAIAAVSIGRRLLNPLHELVKVPPRSLGLGMYQHDVSEKDLDEKLRLTSMDAVATVGVDSNTCSLEILEKVPGLQRLAPKILEARPLRYRSDLMKISGLGPKTFENCAAFVRVHGNEPLDATLVHPESYDLARFLLKQLKWTLSAPPPDLPPREQWESQWKDVLESTSDKFAVSRERVVSVLENLVDSMTRRDPRMTMGRKKAAAGSIDGCSMLEPDVLGNLQKACPVRKILGTIRNIADFGAFVDFGGHRDGLLHRSNLGTGVELDSLLIGQQIGIDILSAEENGRISLGLTGLELQPANAQGSSRQATTMGKVSTSKPAVGGQKRSYSSSSSKTGKRRKLRK